jgi:hypothetical protein
VRVGGSSWWRSSVIGFRERWFQSVTAAVGILQARPAPDGPRPAPSSGEKPRLDAQHSNGPGVRKSNPSALSLPGEPTTSTTPPHPLFHSPGHLRPGSWGRRYPRSRPVLGSVADGHAHGGLGQ